MQNLIDLEALQPTGDLSSVTLKTLHSFLYVKLTYVILLQLLFCVFVLGKEICSVLLGQSIKPKSRSATDFGSYWRGKKSWASFSKPFLILKTSSFSVAGLVCNFTGSTIPFPINIHICHQSIFHTRGYLFSFDKNLWKVSPLMLSFILQVLVTSLIQIFPLWRLLLPMRRCYYNLLSYNSLLLSALNAHEHRLKNRNSWI